MKQGKKFFMSAVLIMIAAASFFAGRCSARAENAAAKREHCRTLITFATDKAENQDLSDEGTMRAMISDVYAAYRLCDDDVTANRLHDLWNFLIFEGDGDLESAKEIALIELNAAFAKIKEG